MQRGDFPHCFPTSAPTHAMPAEIHSSEFLVCGVWCLFPLRLNLLTLCVFTWVLSEDAITECSPERPGLSFQQLHPDTLPYRNCTGSFVTLSCDIHRWLGLFDQVTSPRFLFTIKFHTPSSKAQLLFQATCLSCTQIAVLKFLRAHSPQCSLHCSEMPLGHTEMFLLDNGSLPR